MIILKILNLFHLLILFLPFLLVIIPAKNFKNVTNIMKVIALIYFLIPLHWLFFDNRCIFTIFSIKMGDYQGTNQTIAFTQSNLRPIYEPIMNLIGLKWNKKKDINIMINIHWIIIFIIMWYIIAYKIC